VGRGVPSRLVLFPDEGHWVLKPANRVVWWREVHDWLAKYLNVFLWLPVANIFGSIISQIQQEMIKLDIAQLNSTGQTVFGPTDTAYLIFLVMGIAGYCTVPSVANYIVRAGGGGARHLYSFIHKILYHV